jgi:integrase
LAICLLGSIKQIHVEQYKRERLEVPVGESKRRKPASMNRELACLSKLFSMARENGLLKEVPYIKLLREDNERKRYLTDSEEKQLMDALDLRNYVRHRPLVILALNTGMRAGEMVGLLWKQIDFHRNCINVTNTKSGKDRAIPLNNLTRDMLHGLRESDPAGERVFNDIPRVSKSFANLCRRAGIEDFHFHDLRHTFATRIADGGQNPFTIAYLLGHSNIQMTARYTHRRRIDSVKQSNHLISRPLHVTNRSQASSLTRRRRQLNADSSLTYKAVERNRDLWLHQRYYRVKLGGPSNH